MRHTRRTNPSEAADSHISFVAILTSDLEMLFLAFWEGLRSLIVLVVLESYVDNSARLKLFLPVNIFSQRYWPQVKKIGE